MRKEKKEEITLKNGNYEDFSVSYYLLEDSGKDLYGISVEKSQESAHELEVEEVVGISHSREEAICVLRKLAKYQITPISVLETIDEIIDMEET